MIKYPNKNILYQAAINQWGKPLQYGLLSEEVGELLVAVNKYRRGKVPKGAVIEEIADVRIMLEQIAYLLDIKNSSINKKTTEKLDKMKEMLNRNTDAP